MQYKECLLYHGIDPLLSNQELFSLNSCHMCVWCCFSFATLFRPNCAKHYFASNKLEILEGKQLTA